MGRALKVDIQGLDKLLTALHRFPQETTRELRLEMRKFTRDVQAEAAQEHRFTSRSGNLERSIASEVKPDGTEGKVFLDTGLAPYGPLVHQGTDPYVIAPKRRRALRWVSGGGFAFAKRVNHPGLRPDRFLFKAFDRKAPTLQPRMDAAFGRIIQKAGL